MRRNPTLPTFMLCILLSFFMLFGSCQKDSDLFAEAVLDEPISVTDDENSTGNDSEVEVFTVSLNAVDDAYMQDGKAYNESIVRVETGQRTTYLKFDLSVIEGTITNAYLEFTTDSDQGNGHLQAFKGIGDNWTEEDLSMDNAPELGDLLGELDGDYVFGESQKLPLDFEVLSTSMTSIILNINTGNDIAIASKESTRNPGPKLVVEYTGSVSAETEEGESEDNPIQNNDVITLNDLKAFPSAFGAAADITGGRGGTIYEVTNLNDSGPGSFRAAFQALGNRIIIIKVEGLVNKASAFKNLQPGHGDVSIWGQFAPGNGITLKGGRFSWSNAGNIIIRHITAQNGDVDCTVNVNCHGALNIYSIEAGKGVYIDHSSFRYGADQIFDIQSSDNNQIKVTAAYNLVAEGVEEHNTGGIFGGSIPDNGLDVGNYTIARNMWYNISHRFPNLGGSTGNFELYNNYIVNWKSRLTRGNGALNVDWHDNYADAGNKSKSSDAPVNKWRYDSGEWNGRTPKIYSSGNFIEGWDEMGGSNQQDLWVWYKSASATIGSSSVEENRPLDASLFSSTKMHNFELPNDGVWSWNQIPQKMESSVGHNRGINSDGSPGFFRDDLDAEYVERSLSGTTPSDYRHSSEWSDTSFRGTNLYIDSDGDYMPDWFEARHPHLNPNDPSDMLKKHTNWNFDDYSVVNNAGYSNLEICAEYYAGGFEILMNGTNDFTN